MSSCFDHSIKIWDFKSTTSLKNIVHHTHWINWVINTKCVTGKDIIISGGSDKTITVMDLETGKLFKTIPTRSWVYRLIVIPDLYDGVLFVSSDGFDEINIWR